MDKVFAAACLSTMDDVLREAYLQHLVGTLNGYVFLGALAVLSMVGVGGYYIGKRRG